MVSLIDLAILVLAATSLGVMVRTLKGQEGLLRVSRSGGGFNQIKVEGDEVKPVMLIAEEPPEIIDAERISRALAGVGVDYTLAYTIMYRPKSEILSILEREQGRLEVLYGMTKAPVYKSRLEALKGVYAEVAKASEPVLHTTALILWLRRGEEALERAARGVLEAELGTRFRRVEGDPIPHLIGSARPRPSPPRLTLSWDPEGSGRPIVIGRTMEGKVAVLRWPRDFERHVGVVGPTGQGKTVLLSAIALQASIAGAPVAVIDPKGDLAMLLEKHADAFIVGEAPSEGSAWDPAPSGLTVYHVDERSGSRIARKLHSRRRKPTLLIVDEAWRISGSLAPLLREGRSLGVHVVYATQTPRDMGMEALSNTGVYIVFGGPWRGYLEEAARLGIHDPAMLEGLPTGEAVLVKGYSASRPLRVRVLPFHEILAGLGEPAREALHGPSPDSAGEAGDGFAGRARVDVLAGD